MDYSSDAVIFCMELVTGRVMIFGTFDVFHPGHRHFIEQALEEGQELIIVVARDKTVMRFKQRLKNAETERLRVVQEAYPGVKVLLGHPENPMKVVEDYRPEIVCLGYDQVGFSQQLVKEFPHIKIKRLKALSPEKYKSSKM